MKQSEFKDIISSVFGAEKSDLQIQLEDSITEYREKMRDSVALNDDYGNPLLSIGTDDRSAEFTNYTFSNDTLNYVLWMSLYNDSWVFKRAIDKPAQDAIRAGITIQGAEDYTKVYKQLQKYKQPLINLLQWGALFGGSVAVMMFDTFDSAQNDYLVSMRKNLKKIKAAKRMRMYVTDRWYGCQPSYGDTVKDMGDLDYGKPMWYTITFADGSSMKIHHDYIMRYEHRTAPNLIKLGMLQGWGYAEGAHIFNELMRDDKLKSSIQSLIDKALIEIIKMPGMRGIFMSSDSDDNKQLKARLEMVNWARNYNSLTFLDKEDEYTQHEFSGLSGLSNILETNMWQIAAALEMQGVLFGDLKQGFSNDVDALERYSEAIMGRCDAYVRPVMNKLLKVLYIMQGINEIPEFDFNSLIREKQDEKRMDGFNKFIDSCSKLLQDGVITTKQYAIALRNYSQKGQIAFDLTDDEINDLDDETLKEDFNFENEKAV